MKKVIESDLRPTVGLSFEKDECPRQVLSVGKIVLLLEMYNDILLCVGPYI